MRTLIRYALRLCGSAGIMLSVLTAPTATQAETLADALVGAYRNSNLLEQNRALLRAADEGVALEVSKLRPILNYSLTQTHTRNAVTGVSNSTTAALSASLLLWDFGTTDLGIEAKKETVLATRASLIDVEQAVLLNAVRAYVQVRSAAETLALRHNNVRLITQQLRAARDRFEVGEVTRTDVALAESRLALARSNLVAAEGALATAREAYKIAVGRFPGDLTPPPPAPLTARSLADARAIAVRTHPAVIEAQHSVRANELAADAAELGIMPTLRGAANMSRTVGNSNTGGSLSLTLSGPLYSGGAVSSSYRQALARVDQSRYGLRQTMLTVEQAAANAWYQIEVSRASIEASQRQIEASTVAFNGVREEATLGARTTLDVLDAEQDLLDARTALINAEASSSEAVYTLMSAMGLLTAQHLQLGIPTYDPAAYYNAVKNAPETSTRGARLDRVMESIGRN